MSYVSSAKLLLRFDNSLIDSITTDSFLTAHFTPAYSVDPVSLQLSQGGWIYARDLGLSISDRMTISFRFFPVNSGVARNPTTGSLETMQMPLLDFGEGADEPYSSDYLPINDVCVLYEKCLEEHMNQLVIYLADPAGNTYYAVTEPYDTTSWHQVWIAWSGISSQIRVFIDGKIQLLSETGSMVTLINGGNVGFWLNVIPTILSTGYDFCYNYNKIRDLIVLNDFIDTVTTIQRSINFSIDYAFDTIYANIDEVSFPVFFNDPSAIKIMDMVFDGKYFYSTRSDGKVMQGSPLFWQTRRDFAIKGESDVLHSFSKDTVQQKGVDVSDGLLKIRNGTVRL